MEVFKQDAGLDMVHVPYKGGAGPAVTDVLGGHVDLMFTTISSAMEYVKEQEGQGACRHDQRAHGRSA